MPISLCGTWWKRRCAHLRPHRKFRFYVKGESECASGKVADAILLALDLLWLFGSVAARAAAPASAEAPGYDAIYVFGDSYCDVGNIYAATGGATRTFAALLGCGPIIKRTPRLSTSPTLWGLPMKASLLGGTSLYAFGGAYVLSDQVTLLGAIPSVRIELIVSEPTWWPRRPEYTLHPGGRGGNGGTCAVSGQDGVAAVT